MSCRSLELVAGARPPADAREAALVTSLGSPERFSLIVATSRDDGWSGPVAHFSAAARHRFSTVVFSSLVAGTTCQGSWGGAIDPSTRLATWVAFMDPASLEVVDTACASWQSQLARPNLDDPYITADGSPDLCMPSPVVRLPGGEADCVVDVIMPAAVRAATGSSCASARAPCHESAPRSGSCATSSADPPNPSDADECILPPRRYSGTTTDAPPRRRKRARRELPRPLRTSGCRITLAA